MAWYTIMLAGGSGSRMGADCNKVFLPLAGEPMLCRSICAFRGLVKGIVLVAQPEEITVCKTLMTSVGLSDTVCAYVPGGSDRQGSVHNGLAALPADCD